MSGETATEDVYDSFIDRHRATLASLKRGWSRFKQDRLGVIGVLILVTFVLMAVFAPMLAPHDPNWRAPETITSEGEGVSEDASLDDQLAEVSNKQLDHPSPPKFGDPYFAPLGTTDRGHDVLSRLIYGARVTLYIGLAAGLLSSLVGIPVGIISGFYGDTAVDEAIQRLIDILYAVPFLPLMIIFVASFGITTTNVILAIVVKSWLNNAIVIRGQVLSLKERSYIEAAKVAGSSDRRIMFRHILPNVLPLGIIYLAQDAAYAILAHATLAFLGYADPSALAWGTELQWVQVTGNQYLAWWWMVPAGTLIVLVAAAFYFVGYSLENVTNPETNA